MLNAKDIANTFIIEKASKPLEEGLHYININQAKIPVISEISSFLPVGHVRLVFIGGGNVYNPSKKPLAKVASLILNHGTKKLGNVKFADMLDSKAVSIDSSIGETTFNIELDFLKEYEDFALQRLQEVLLDPNITESALNDIKTRLKSSLLSKQSDFDYQASILLRKGIFANTPLAYPAIGNKAAEIDSVTLDDIRHYVKENLVLNRLIIVIGGDIQLESSLQNLASVLSHLQNGKKVSIPHYKVKHTDTKIAYKDTQQAFIYFATPFNVDNLREDDYKARVAGFILGSSGFGSRLMEEVRVKRGLAYSAYMYPNLSMVNNAFFGYVQTALDKQDETIALVKEIVGDFVKNGATQKELDSAKQFIIGNKPLKEETLSQRLSAKFMNYYNGLPLDYGNEFVSKVKELDLKTLNDFIASHTELENLTFSIITSKDK